MSASQLRLPDQAQQWADQATGALGTSERLVADPALTRLCEWLEQDDHLVNCVGDGTNWFHAPDLPTVAERAWSSFEGTENDETILAHLHDTMRSALEGDAAFWGEEYPVHVRGAIAHTDGRSAILGFRFSRFDE